MAAYGQFSLVEALTRFLPNFMHVLLLSNSRQSEKKVYPMNSNKMAAKMATSCRFARVYTLINIYELLSLWFRRPTADDVR